MTTTTYPDDILWQHLKSVPAFRALLRAVEARFYHAVDLPGPILDLGCGDGHFAGLTFDRPLDAGFDPWWGPLKKAQRGGQYTHLAQAMGDRMPYPDNHFGTVISNSVLEHIPDLQPVLAEANRVLQPGGRLVITMPSHLFTEYLGGAALFKRLGLLGLADNYRYFFNRISRHAHTDPPELWAQRLALAGFAVERWQYYFSRGALRALELGHFQGLPAAIMHALTGWWVVAPWRSSLSMTDAWVRPYFEEPFPEKGAYLFFVAYKSGAPQPAGTTFSVTLPPPRPFTLAELEAAQPVVEQPLAEQPVPAAALLAEAPGQEITVTVAATDAGAAAGAPDEAAGRPNSRRLLDGGLIVVALLAAMLGQTLLNGAPDSPDGGLFWYGVSLAAAGLLLLRRRGLTWRWPQPNLAALPPQRWFYLLGLLFVVVAGRQVNGADVPRPTLALLFWLAGSAAALAALWPATRPAPAAAATSDGESRWLQLDFLTPILLFLAALNLRLFNLVGHPFILNGNEANLGLEVLRVVDGGLRSPFSTGWLTNPTLPLFIMAGPLKVLGPSVLGIRVLSPIIGAAAVAATYSIGRRLWGREVGLAAAILLLGSHFHLHFSRLGMTNIWDPLLALLGLGLLGIAWRENQPRHWLYAGIALGLNAYAYTSAHLMPLMLLGLGLWLAAGAIRDAGSRDMLRQRGHGLARAGLMALVVAWPQIAFFNTNPPLFMERANVLGIFQSGWLRQEAALTGQSELSLLWEQVKGALLAFNYGLDVGPSYNPGVPLLRFWPALLFVAGLAVALRRRGQFRYRLLLVWWLVTIIFAGALLQGVPNSHRLVIATPALSLLAAGPLVWLVRRLTRVVPALGGQRLLLAAGLAAFIAVLDIAFYFGPYQNQPRFGDRNTEAAHEMALYLNGLDGDWTAYFYGPPSMYVGFPNIPFLARDFRDGGNLWDVVDTLDTLPAPATSNVTFIYLPERFNELGVTQAQYPGGEVRPVEGVYANPLFYVYEVRR